MEYVYVMYRHDKGLYKIGHSANPFDRMRSVKNQYKLSTITLGFVMANRYAEQVENFLHHKFTDNCVDGEWFKFENTDFLRDVLDACLSRDRTSVYHHSPTSTYAIGDKRIYDIIDEYYVVTPRYIEPLLDNNYSTIFLSGVLKYNKCIICSGVNNVKCYVTPKGQELCLHLKENAKERRKLINKKIEDC